MIKTRFLMAAALAGLTVAAHAAGGDDVNLDGSAKAAGKATLATTANRQLQRDDVPSATTDPTTLKAKADADMAARDARAKAPRVVVQRQNLKGAAAARALQQQATPASIDHATAYGDKDHTEQMTDLKLTLKK